MIKKFLTYVNENSVEIVKTIDFSKLIGMDMSPGIREKIDDHEDKLKKELIGRRISFMNAAGGPSRRRQVTIQPIALEIKISFKLHPDFSDRLKMGMPVSTSEIERISIFIYTSEEIYSVDPGDEIEILKGEQRIGDDDPYGEEDWGDENFD